MAGTVHLPGIGSVDERYVWGGGALVVGIVAYAWWTRGRAAAAADAVDTSDAVDDGSGAAVGTDWSAEGTGDAAWPFTPGGSTLDPGNVDPESLPPTTYAEWTTRAVSQLGELGFAVQDVVTAAGLRYAHRQMSAAQGELMSRADALIGPPPGDSYPILVAAAPPTTTGGTGGGSTAAPHYVFTGKGGTPTGHTVSVAYMIGIGMLTPVGGRLTGKFQTQRGHPFSYSYLVSTGYIRKV